MFFSLCKKGSLVDFDGLGYVFRKGHGFTRDCKGML